MLAAFAHSDTMIEVLLSADLPLPADTRVVCYDQSDHRMATDVLSSLGVEWVVDLRDPPDAYNRSSEYVRLASAFMARALAEPAWLGDGLEFDRV